MATHTATGTTGIPPGLRLSNDLNDVLTNWSTSQRKVIGLAAELAESGEWMASGAVSAAHWIAGATDIEVCTSREWIRVGRHLRVLPPIADMFEADELSYSKVRTRSRIAMPENEQQLPARASAPRSALGDVANRIDGLVAVTLQPLIAGTLISQLTAPVMSTPPDARTPVDQWPTLAPTARRCTRAHPVQERRCPDHRGARACALPWRGVRRVPTLRIVDVHLWRKGL